MGGGGGGGGGQAARTAPRYLPSQTPLFKCLLWTRTPANWLQLTLYQDELENERQSFPLGKKKKKDGGKPHTYTERRHVRASGKQAARFRTGCTGLAMSEASSRGTHRFTCHRCVSSELFGV